jgi:PhnB protein
MKLDDINIFPDRNIAPNLIVHNVEEAISFYHNGFGAEVLAREAVAGPARYAKLRIGNSSIIVSEESVTRPGAKAASPRNLGGTSATFELFVDDFDKALARALQAGGTALESSAPGAYFGDQTIPVVDPFGHVWILSTFLDDGGALCI